MSVQGHVDLLDMKRRGQLDPFLATHYNCWLVDEDTATGTRSIQRLAPETDLQIAFAERVNHYRTTGWTVENEPIYPCVFVNKNRVRRMLTLSKVNPDGESLRHFSPWND